MIGGAESLIIAEHIIATSQFHGAASYPKWSDSFVRNTTLANLFNDLEFLETRVIIKNDIMTRDTAYAASGSFETTTDSIFLLGIEEAFYAGEDDAAIAGSGGTPISNATTGTSTERTNGNTVIFADGYARSATDVSGLGSNSWWNWWLRSPNYDSATSNASMVNQSEGYIANWGVNKVVGIRPALWINFPKEAAPTALINYESETLTGLAPNAAYLFNGEDGTADADGTYPIDSDWMDGSALAIIKKGDEINTSDSEPQNDLIIPVRLDAPNVSGVNETVIGKNDGKITGYTADMEYKLADALNWTSTPITGLAPGNYEVRLKATNSDFASAAASVTISAGAAPAPTTYAVTVTGGSGSASYEAGATVTITANAAEDGKVFDTWTSDGVTFADPSSLATSFTMPAKAVTVTANYKDDPSGGGDDPNPPATDNGWIYANSIWKFFIDGVAQTGWVYDQSTWYYLNADGIMQTGWVYDQSDKAWYYLAGNGAMKTGWVKDDGDWYYLAGNGAMVANKWFHDTDGSWYYLSGNGKMLTGKQNVGGKVYSFKTNGMWIG
ncbi:MAG: DUF6273 domain-containing protein [Clostridiales Family XIII bacterium]|nr:DUF6273 domain-containing protein [Clostridiales Family XIII bacterium]